MFPNEIKERIKEDLISNIDDLKEKFPEIKNKINIEPGTYSISYNLQSSPLYRQFASDNSKVLESKYQQLIASSGLSISPADGQSISDAALDYFIDDFYEYLIYYLVESEDISSNFEKKWAEFETELYAPNNKLTVIARIKNLYCHGWLENILPGNYPKLYRASSAFEYRLLGWERNGSRHFKFIEEFLPPWILIKEDFDVTLPNQIKSNIQSIIDRFNFVMFVIRTEIKGNPYFNNVRLFGLAHYSPQGFITTSLKEVMDNDINEEFGQAATIQNPLDGFLRNLFNKIDPNDYSKFEFIDWQLRMMGKLEIDYKINYSSKRTKYYHFQKLLNLTSMMNSLLPDLGNSSNDKNRKIYLSELLSKIYSIDKKKLEETFKNTYQLRNNIVHGNITDINKLMNTIYNDIKILEEDLRFLEYIISKIIQLTLANPTFKVIEESYYKSNNPLSIPSLTNPFS